MPQPVRRECEMVDPELPDYATTTAALPRPPPAPSPPRPPTPPRAPSNPRADYRHTYKLENSIGHPWLYLSLNSRAPDRKVSPLFFDRDKVEGQVGLNLQRTENIKFISITVRRSSLVSSCYIAHELTRRLLAVWRRDGCRSRRRTVPGGDANPVDTISQ